LEIKDAAIVNKLILLFFIDKMDVALTESTILKACYYQNPWMEYMDCMSALNQLQESEFLFRAVYEKTAYYSITPGGRECISGFYTRIPASIRTDISEFVKDNRLSIRRRQEYTTSYSLNPDKTYGVSLKIIDPTNPQRITLDLKFNVPNKEIAKAVAEKWNAKAASIYSDLYEQLVDE
jgi:hypothetical protein